MRPSTPTVLELDFRERDGFQIGKAAALADWQARKVRAKDRERKARKRKSIVLTCQREGCGKTFRPRRYRAAKWCSSTCRNLHHTAHGKPRNRNRGIRNMQLAPTVFAILRDAPGLTLRELCERDPTVKRGSLATKLTAWTQEGLVVRDGKKNGRYRLARGAA